MLGGQRHDQSDEMSLTGPLATARWRVDYNTAKSHSRIAWQTPDESASTFTPRRSLALRYANAPAPATAASPARQGKTNAGTECKTRENKGATSRELRGCRRRPSALRRSCPQRASSTLGAWMAEPAAVRGSTRPAPCQNLRLIVSPQGGALQSGVNFARRLTVHDHDVAGAKLGCENLLGIGEKCRTVHRAVEQHRRRHAGQPPGRYAKGAAGPAPAPAG